MPNLDRFNDNAYRYFHRPEKQKRCIACSRDIRFGELCDECEMELDCKQAEIGIEEGEEDDSTKDYLSVFVGLPLLWFSSIYFLWVVYG